MAAARAMAAAQAKRKAAAVAHSPVAVGGVHQDDDLGSHIGAPLPSDEFPVSTVEASRASKKAKVNNTVVSASQCPHSLSLLTSISNAL